VSDTWIDDDVTCVFVTSSLAQLIDNYSTNFWHISWTSTEYVDYCMCGRNEVYSCLKLEFNSQNVFDFSSILSAFSCAWLYKSGSHSKGLFSLKFNKYHHVDCIKNMFIIVSPRVFFPNLVQSICFRLFWFWHESLLISFGENRILNSHFRGVQSNNEATGNLFILS